MSILDFFRRRRSAPLARERLQVLLAYERQNRHLPDLVALLREEILAVITRHVRVGDEDVHVKMARGETMSTLAIDINIPNGGGVAAVF
jgi:cell division topological specificity factor